MIQLWLMFAIFMSFFFIVLAWSHCLPQFFLIMCMSMFQSFNVLRYEIGQRYQSHYDAFNPAEYGPQKSQRVNLFLFWTVLEAFVLAVRYSNLWQKNWTSLPLYRIINEANPPMNFCGKIWINDTPYCIICSAVCFLYHYANEPGFRTKILEYDLLHLGSTLVWSLK